MEKYKKLLAPVSEVLQSGSAQRWIDLGCGAGLFTQLLAEFLPDGSTITAIDNVALQRPMVHNDVRIAFQRGDFIKDQFALGPVDGILMANALHFVADKASLIRKWEQYFEMRRQWLIVEYEHMTPNEWEPYPVNYESLEGLFLDAGYDNVAHLGAVPSRYGGMMYAAFIR